MPALPCVVASVRVLLVVVALVAAPAVQASSAERILPEGPFRCGESYIISLAVHLDNGTRFWGIDETLPAGWKATLPSQGGSTETPGHAKWVKFSQSGDGLPDTTVRYFAYIPRGFVGNATFPDSEFSDGSGPTQPIVGERDLTVSCASPGPIEEDNAGSGSSSFFAGFSPIWLVLILAVAVLGVIWIVRGRLPKS